MTTIHSYCYWSRDSRGNGGTYVIIQDALSSHEVDYYLVVSLYYNIYIVRARTCRYGMGDRQRESTTLRSACTTTTYSRCLSTSRPFKSNRLCDTSTRDKYLKLAISSMFVRFLKNDVVFH